MNVMALLDYLQEEVERANKVPFSDTVMVDREKMLNIINDVRITLPNELMEAEAIRNQSAQIIEDAQVEAKNVVDEAKAQARQMIEENAVTQQAYAQAQEILERAQNGAREVRRSANEYVEDVLSEMESYISRNLDMVRANREQMRGR